MPVICLTTTGKRSCRIFLVAWIPRRKLPVDNDWRSIGLHNDLLPLKVIVTEDWRAIAAKDGRQDMFIILNLVSRPLACFQGVHPNDPVNQFVLCCK